MDNQTLEMIIKASADAATNAVSKLKKELGNFKAGFEDATGSAYNFSNAIWSLGKLSLTGIITVFNKLFTSIKSASDRAEELNLFNVVFKNIEINGKKTFSVLGQEATRFQNKLNDAFGTNMTDTLRYQALFQSMGENSGIKDKYANIMSENLTKMTYDLASLYNKSEKETAEALKSGIYAGQTKPMRKYGVDVTQGSLSPLLTQLGITDRTISQMSQAEKQILRYIGTMNQAKVAMKDFAQTIESPANQLKVLKNQFAELKVAIGNLFLGMFQQILPYANAILMVLKELAKAIASFFGISVKDYNSGIGALEEESDAWDGIGASAGNATKAAKEYKKQILSFDQIHNLTTPTSSGSSGGGGGGAGNLTGSIDQRLLDAIKGYDNLMDQVKMKATQLRDKWLEILGFQKVLNPITGEYEWKYQGLGKTLSNLWEKFKNMNPTVRLFTSLLAGIGISKLITLGGKLIKVLGLGSGGLGGAIVSLFSPLKSITSYFKVYNNLAGKEGLTGTKKFTSALGESIDAWKRSAGAMERFTTGVKGIVTSIAGVALMKNAFDDIAQSGANLLNVAEAVGGAFSTIAGGVELGASIGGKWGAAIGGAVGIVASLVEAIKGLAYAHDELQQKLDKATSDITEKYDSWKNSMEGLRESYNIVDNEMDYYSRLYNELTQIVDENGKIKSGYEERAAFITGELSTAFGVEIKVVDGVIQEYDKLKGSIQETIEKERNRLKLVALEEQAKEAIKEETNARDDLRKQEILLAEAQEHYNQVKGLGTGVELDAINKLQQAQSNYDKAKERLDGYTNTIKEWEHATGLAATNNTKELSEYFAYEKDLLGKSDEERYQYWEKTIKDNNDYLKQLEKDRSVYGEEEYKAKKKQYEDMITLAEEKQKGLRLTLLTQQGILTNDMVLEWQKLGKESSKDCLAEFEKLPKNMQNELYSKMVSTGEGISKELQKGLNKIKLSSTVTFNGDTSPLTRLLNKFTQSSAFKTASEIANVAMNYSFKAKGGIWNGSNWSNIPQYANGGAPRHGTLFAAGENGAEIVGNINRRTEVLNRSQIASAIYSAVASAMSNANIGGGEVHLYAHTDEGVIIDRINSKTKQTGRCPINIPA